jgi:hypothetical protein
VFAIVVWLIYSWTILLFLWKLPNWLYFLDKGEILISLAYALAVNLLESLAVLGVLALLAALLPPAWLLDRFVARGSALAIAGLGWTMFLAYHFRLAEDFHRLLPAPWGVPLMAVSIAAAVFAAGRAGWLRRALEGLAERATVFLYGAVTASCVSLAAVIVVWIVRASA